MNHARRARRARKVPRFAALLPLSFMLAPAVLRAQGGPPFLSNDPGTPGNANWEINLAMAQSVTRGGANYQAPQIDLNFGVGDRIQLTYEVPYVVSAANGPAQSGWGNGYPGVKWRFLDQGEEGWKMSVFPQAEMGISAHAADRGLGDPGTRYLLPMQVTKKIGGFDVDAEAGYYLAGRSPRERILGLVVGRELTARLELDAEVYDDRAADALPRYTSLDLGGRFKLSRGFIALLMVGRSISGFGADQPEYMGYFGIQILLSDYGRRLIEGP